MKKLIALLCALALTANATDVLLGWNPNDPLDLVTGYNVYWAKGGNNFEFHAMTDGTTLVVSNLVQGINKFYVTATNTIGESIPSNTVQVPGNKPKQVTGVVIIQVLNVN